MKRFCVVSQNGEVLRTGTCQDDMIDVQAGNGEASIEIPPEHDMPANHYYEDGAFIDLSAQPSPHHRFDFAAKAWVLDIDQVTWAAIQSRNAALSESDWTQLPDVPLATKSAWAAYRQALRDITDQPGYPLSISWPEMPA